MIATGVTSEQAAELAGVSGAVGARWFRHGGGMPSIGVAPLSGRYLSFQEREEIAIFKAQGAGVRQIALGPGAPVNAPRGAPERPAVLYVGGQDAAVGQQQGVVWVIKPVRTGTGHARLAVAVGDSPASDVDQGDYGVFLLGRDDRLGVSGEERVVTHLDPRVWRGWRRGFRCR